MKGLLLFVILCSLPVCAATTYYVATTGSDANFPCTAIGLPCQHIGRVVSQNFIPANAAPVGAGDTVNVRAGTYRETLLLENKGVNGSPITLQAYNGESVIIDGSTAVPTSGSWAVDSGSIYKATVNFTVSAVVVDNTVYLPASVISDPSPRSAITVTSSTWYQDLGTNTLYLWVAAGDSPANHDIIALQAGQGVSTNSTIYGCSAEYWILDHLIVRGSKNYGINFDGTCSTNGTNNIVRNSTVWFNNWTGIGGFVPNTTIQSNTIWWNMMYNFPRGRCADPVNLSNNGSGTNETVTVNAAAKTFTRTGTSFVTDGVVNGTYIQFTSGFSNSGNTQVFLITNVAAGVVTVSDPGSALVNEASTTAFYKAHGVMNQPSCQVFGGWGAGTGINGGSAQVLNNDIEFNGGEGSLSYFGPGSNVWRGNTVKDNWSVNIYQDNEPNNLVERNIVTCNPSSSWTTNSGVIDATALTAQAKRLRGVAYGTADEFYDGTTHLQGWTIRANVAIGCRRGYNHSPDVSGSGIINAKLVSNVFIVPSVNGIGVIGEPFGGIFLPYTSTNSNSLIENNIVYGQGSTNVLLLGQNGTSIQEFTGLTINYNSWYHATNATPFSWAGSTMSWASWQSLVGTAAHGANDVHDVDPSLVNATSLVATDKALASSASPVYHLGTTVSGDTLDYLGNSFANTPSMGAFEFGASPPAGGHIINSRPGGGRTVSFVPDYQYAGY